MAFDEDNDPTQEPSNDQWQLIYEHLLKYSDNDKLKRGAIKKATNTFKVSRKAIGKILQWALEASSNSLAWCF